MDVFPHWIDIKCAGEKNTLSENWDDDDKLRKLILKTYKWQLKHGNGKFTTNRIRQNAKVYCSKQSVSNFRPTVAKYIYNIYGNSGNVWDMSGGYKDDIICKLIASRNVKIFKYESEVIRELANCNWYNEF